LVGSLSDTHPRMVWWAPRAPSWPGFCSSRRSRIAPGIPIAIQGPTLRKDPWWIRARPRSLKEVSVEVAPDRLSSTTEPSARKERPELPGAVRRRYWRVVQAAMFSLCLWGCANVRETTPGDTGEQKPPAPTAQSTAAPERETPFDQLIAEAKNFLTPRRTKFALAGAGALLVLIVVGRAVGKILKGAPPPRVVPPPGEWGDPSSPDVGNHSRSA
jgi:hypothetical protein